MTIKDGESECVQTACGGGRQRRYIRIRIVGPPRFPGSIRLKRALGEATGGMLRPIRDASCIGSASAASDDDQR